MPHRTINGASLYVEESGSGPETIVFAHGLLWDGRMFAPQIEALRAHYRCVTFDFRGQGKSERTVGGYDMDTLTEDAAHLIDALGCAPCHFVGLSMGGFVGLRLALRRPTLLQSLTLIASAADSEPLRNVPKYGAMALGARMFGVRPFGDAVMNVMFGHAFLTDPSRAAERAELRARLLAVDPAGAAHATVGVITRDPVDAALSRVHVPTHVIAGEQDRAIVPARARRTAARIPGAELTMIPAAGHTSTLEEPRAVTAALTSFLARHAMRTPEQRAS